MTRKEQIWQAALTCPTVQIADDFYKGAEWADEHPDLYSVTRKAVEREREYMIDKFCEFLESCVGYVVNGEKCNYDNFIKFMEEQQ